MLATDSPGRQSSSNADHALPRFPLPEQQTYLLLGPTPLLDCHYCKQTLDLQLFALPPLILRYVVHLLCLGVLTTSPSLLNSIDQGLTWLWPQSTGSAAVPTGAHQPARKPRAHSHRWRTPVSLLLLLGCALDVSVLAGMWGWSEDQQSWWNHVSAHTPLQLRPPQPLNCLLTPTSSE